MSTIRLRVHDRGTGWPLSAVEKGSLTTGGGGFRTIPLLERSVPGPDIELASDAGAAQVKDDVLIDTPPAGEDRGDGEGDAPRSNHLVGNSQVNVRRGDPGQDEADLGVTAHAVQGRSGSSCRSSTHS